MTSIYLGSNLYELHIGHQKIQLSGDEISEVISHFIKYPEDNIDVSVVSEMAEKVSEYESSLSRLRDKVSDCVGNIEELMDSEDTEPHHLISELETIKKAVEY